jgi:hypothetical protein
MKHTVRLPALALLAAGAFFAAACSKKETPPPAAQSAAEGAQSAAADLKKAAQDAGAKMTDAANDMKAKASDAAHEMGKKAEAIAADATKQAESALAAAGKKTETAMNDMKTSAGKLMSDAGSTVSTAGSSMSGATAGGWKMPDLTSASTTDLRKLATDSLNGMKSMLGNTEAGATVDKISSALANKDYTTSLNSFSALLDQAKAIPGASGYIEKVKPLLGSVALKDTFKNVDVTQILSALQSGNYAAAVNSLQGLATSGGAMTGEEGGVLQSLLGLLQKK